MRESKFLATKSSLKAFEENDLIGFGTWCLPDKHLLNLRCEKSNDQETKIYKFNFHNTINTRVIYEKLVPELTRFLNCFHKVNYSQLQWETVFGYWLIQTINTLAIRWQQVEEIKSLNNKNIIVLGEIPNNFSPSKFGMAQEVQLRDDFNSYVYLTIVEYFGNLDFEFVESEKSTNFENSFGIRSLLLRCIATVISKSKILLIQKKIFVYIETIPKFKNLEFKQLFDFALIKSVINNLYFKNITIKDIDQNRTITRNPDILGMSSSGETDFEKYLNSVLLRFLPESLVENFSSIIHTLELAGMDFVPNSSLIDVAHFGNDIERIWLGIFGNSKGKVSIVQHGGGYGHYDDDSFYVETRICENFFTWGWNPEDKSSNLEFAPALRLNNGTKNSKFMPDGRILIWLAPEITYPWGISFPNQPMDKNRYCDYLDELSIFLQELSSENFGKVKIRAHNDDFKFAQEYLEKKTKNRLEFFSGNTEKVNSTMLSISTYNGTHSLECLLSGIPTIFFWSSSILNVDPRIVKFINELEIVGVIQTDPVKFAKFISSPEFNILLWWNSSSVQNAVNRYLNHFGNRNGGIENWKRLIEELREENSKDSIKQISSK